MTARKRLILGWCTAIFWLATVAICGGHGGNDHEDIRTDSLQTDCMDVLTRCCEDSGCLLLDQIPVLFQCVEILREPPEIPPYCTPDCHDIVRKILYTEDGWHLTNCSCSSLEKLRVPMISHLCRPFQQNAFSKCYFAGATDAATAKAHTTEPITTEKATTEPTSSAVPTTDFPTLETVETSPGGPDRGSGTEGIELCQVLQTTTITWGCCETFVLYKLFKILL
jgi:hypothetical protein